MRISDETLAAYVDGELEPLEKARVEAAARTDAALARRIQAQKRLRERMAGMAFAAPSIPLVNNVDVAIVNDPQAIKDALVRQAAAPVRWVECVQKIAAQGVTHVIECGPGKVLAGMTTTAEVLMITTQDSS